MGHFHSPFGPSLAVSSTPSRPLPCVRPQRLHTRPAIIWGLQDGPSDLCAAPMQRPAFSGPPTHLLQHTSAWPHHSIGTNMPHRCTSTPATHGRPDVHAAATHIGVLHPYPSTPHSRARPQPQKHGVHSPPYRIHLHHVSYATCHISSIIDHRSYTRSHADPALGWLQGEEETKQAHQPHRSSCLEACAQRSTVTGALSPESS